MDQRQRNIQKVLDKGGGIQTLEAFIKRMERLRVAYQTTLTLDGCPLCELECGKCPWRVFTGAYCGIYANKWDDRHDRAHWWKSRHQDLKWRALRRNQLTRWISYYKEALNEKRSMQRLSPGDSR